jgi:hypothetical protein
MGSMRTVAGALLVVAIAVAPLMAEEPGYAGRTAGLERRAGLLKMGGDW